MDERRLRLEKANRMNAWLYTGILIVVLTIVLLALTGIVSINDFNATVLAAIGGAIVILMLVLLIRSTFDMREALEQQAMLVQALDGLGDLNRTLRAQRHDFLNHLQVVYSLMEMESYEEATRYIDQVYGDIGRVSRSLRTAQPAVNAVLQAKMAMCDEKGIDVNVFITDDLSHLPMPAWEVCRILGNIIDNAMDALEDTEEAKIRIELYGDVRGVGFRISNNGPAIPEAFVHRIFQEGVSSKGDSRGMGLHIVRDLLARYRGTIEVATGAWTVFTVWMPRHAEALEGKEKPHAQGIEGARK